MRTIALLVLVLSLQTFSQSTQDWAVRYNGSGNGTDIANAMVVDGAGNVYVTGHSIQSGTSYDYVTIKYDTKGVWQWGKSYNGTGNAEDWARAIAVDRAGNVYVTGGSGGSGTSENDYFTIKYNNDGEWQWGQVYNGPGNGNDEAASIAVDGAGNVYVTGESMGNGTLFDYATVKYDSNGTEQWVQRFHGEGDGRDMARAIAVDGSGNVYVTGQSTGSGTGLDQVTIKYNTSGIWQWGQSYNGSGNSDDDALAIAVDRSGNVYVTGDSWESGGAGSDYATIKYNSEGVGQWLQTYNGPPGTGLDYAFAIALDDSANVYVTGNSSGSGTGPDYATIKYDTDGYEQWVSRYNGPGNTFDYAYSIAVDRSGNSYVTGRSSGAGTGSDYATLRYSPNGVQQWVARYTANEYDWASSIALDNSGNVYVTGRSSGTGTSEDYATIKYSQHIISPSTIPVAIHSESFSCLLAGGSPGKGKSLRYTLPRGSQVRIRVFNGQGRLLKTLKDSFSAPGSYSISADFEATGIYFLEFKAGMFSKHFKIAGM